MLMEAAHAREVPFLPLCKDENDPAAQFARSHSLPFEIGSPDDPEIIQHLFKQPSLILFESEFVDLTALRNLANLEFFPSLECIEILRDKLSQKKLFRKLSLPSSPFLENPSPEDALRKFPEGAVLKWAKGGYDGKGVFLLKVAKTESIQAAKRFLEEAKQSGSETYAEAFVPFEKELACAYVMERSGSLQAFPLVLSEQERGICKVVRGPATLLGLKPALETSAREIAKTLAGAVYLQGVFAIEFFLTKSGALLINEVAPRVHNSAHYTQEFALSQFTAHLLAATGAPVLPIESPPRFFAMWNLLGPESLPKEGIPTLDTLPPPPPETRLHWYGKTKMTPGRKLGHLNTSGASTPSELDSRIARMKEWEQRLFP